MKIDYDYQGKGYAGAEKKMDLLNLDGYDGFYMYLYGDGSDNDLKLQVETDVSTFAYTGYLSFEGGKECFLPFDGFKECDWAGSGHELDASNNLKSVSIYTDQTGTVESGTFYIDDLRGSNYVEGACDLQTRKEAEPVVPEDGENLDNVVFKWNFAEDGTDGWSFDGFTPWIENGNLCAWSQDEYQATFSYVVEDVPNGTYALMHDIKVKSNMRNVQCEISSGEESLKSDAIDTSDVLLQDQVLDGRLEVVNNKVTITYYLDSPKDENGTTFMVGDIKLICVKEEKTEESDAEEPESHRPESEDNSDEKNNNEQKPSRPQVGNDSNQEGVSSSDNIPTVTHSSSITIPDSSVPTTGEIKEELQPNSEFEAKQEAKEEAIGEPKAQTKNITNNNAKDIKTIGEEEVPESIDENVTEEKEEIEDVESAYYEVDDTDEQEAATSEEESSGLKMGIVTLIISLVVMVLMGVSLILWRRKNI